MRVPEEILYGHKKGFSVPIEKWMREDLVDYVRELLLSPKSKILSFIKKAYVKNLLESHVSKRTNEGKRLWALLTLEIWMREYFN